MNFGLFNSQRHSQRESLLFYGFFGYASNCLSLFLFCFVLSCYKLNYKNVWNYDFSNKQIKYLCF